MTESNFWTKEETFGLQAGEDVRINNLRKTLELIVKDYRQRAQTVAMVDPPAAHPAQNHTAGQPPIMTTSPSVINPAKPA